MLENIKNNQLFSSKIKICVVNLNQTELATEEDKLYGIDKWVTLFKSKTWEEAKMIAKENPELLEAAKSLYQYNNEDTIRYQCYAREDYRKMMNSIRRTEKERLERIEKQAELIGTQSEQIETQAEKIKELTSQVSEQNAYIKELESKSAKLNK